MAAAQQLIEAIQALYGHPDEKVKRQANDWLEQWQQSVEAWSISDAILHDRSCSIDAHYFCAQTLRTKVKRDFEELPPDAIGSLRDSIMDLLLYYSGVGPMVTVQLCLAFAALVAHVPSSQWGQGGAVQWLMNRLEGQPPKTSIPVMLEMLIILPEEAKNYSPSVRPERRRQLQEEMVNCGPMALQVLASCLGQPGTQTRSRVLEAFAAWLSLTPGAGLPGSQLADHPLTTAALEGLASNVTFDQAVEAMVELIYSTSSRGAPDKDSLALVSRLVPAVISLTPRFAKSCQVTRAEAQGISAAGSEDEEDEDTMKGMARLFAEIGEAFTSMIAMGSQDAMKPVEALLEVAGHPDADICAISFNFWHRLSRQLNSNFSSTSASPQEAEQQVQQRKAPFYPAFTKLVTLIQGRVRYPDNWDLLQEDEKRDFKHSRYAVSDTLLDAASVLGDQRTLQILVEPLQALSQQSSKFDWQTAEAALQCIRSVSKEVVSPNQPLLVALLQSLPQLPAVPRLQYTAALTLGDFSQWMATALDQGHLSDIVPQLLQMLTTALANAESAQAASSAFREVCAACGSRLAPHLDALMQLSQSVQSAGALASPNSASTLDEEGVQQIIEAVVLLISTLPEAQRRASLDAMLQPVVQSLQHSLQVQQHKQQQANGSAPGPSPPSSPQILAQFDRLTTILRYVNDAGAVTEALPKVWPLVEAGLQLFIQNPTAVERICRSPRYALRTAGKLSQTGSTVATMMAAVPRWFAAAPHSCFLYLASELVKTFGDVSRQEGALAELLGQLLETACGRLRRLSQFSEEPDIADDTFLLAGRVLSYSPKLLLNNPRLVATLLDSAQAGILVQHRDAGESVLTFLHRLFEPATLERVSKEAVAQLSGILSPKGGTIFRMLLAGVAGYLPSGRIQSISEAIVSMLQATKEQGAQWFAQAVNLLPPEAATGEDKSRLLLVTAEVAGRDESKSRIGAMDGALLELSELVCRNRRAQDAAQNALLPEDLKQALW